jgi:hypothetical protein
MAAKCLCVCQYGRLVTRKTEKRHEAGQGSSILISSILAQNQSLMWKTRRKKRSRPSLKQQVIGRPAPVRQALLLAKDNSTAGKEFNNYTCNDLSENVHNQGCPSQAILEGDLDLQMGKAGPSQVNADPPQSSLPPFVPLLSGDADEYNLSNLHCSHHIAQCVEKVGLQRWGCNHMWQLIIEESDEEDEVTEEDQVMQEDGVMEDDDSINSDEDEDFQEGKGEFEMPGAGLGQEGVSLQDLLGESFLKKASLLGVSTPICTSTIMSDGCPYRGKYPE